MTGVDGRNTDLRKELDATLQTRRELGEEYETALVDSFLEKVEQRIDDAVDRRVRRHLAEQQLATARDARRPKNADTWSERFGLAIISLVLAIPLTAVAGGVAGTGGDGGRVGRHRRRQLRPGGAAQPGAAHRPPQPLRPRGLSPARAGRTGRQAGPASKPPAHRPRRAPLRACRVERRSRTMSRRAPVHTCRTAGREDRRLTPAGSAGPWSGGG